MEKILIIIPAYNEEESIVDFLKHLKSYVDERYQILVIDDGSTDRTVEIVKKYDQSIHVISQIYNMGYGSALQLGYKYAVKYGFDYVIQMDADGQHDASNIRIIEDILKTDTPADIIIGSRFLKGSTTFDIPRIKKIAIKGFRFIIRVISRQKITDPTSGLQCLNREAFTYYACYTNFDYQYPDANMIVQMCVKGYLFQEFPAVMHKRESGTSMHAGIFNPIRYMCIMWLSIVTVFLREKRKNRR